MKYLLPVFLIFLQACDPGFDEQMKIHNKSGTPLIFYAAYAPHPYVDSSALININRQITLEFGEEGDSIHWVRASVKHDQHFIIHYDGGIGYISFQDTPGAYTTFKRTYDTIYLENKRLNKALMNFNNWKQKVNMPKLGSSAYFTIDILRGDVQ